MGDLARSQQEGSFAKKGADDGDKADYSESKYDEFEGWGGSVRNHVLSCIILKRDQGLTVTCWVGVCVQLFDSSTPYDEDDKDADRIYQAIDDRMDSRRKRRLD